MLELRNCSKCYGTQNIFKNVNIKFSDSGFYAIVGKSGIGKTTLLNMISTLDTPTSGDILLDGLEYSKLSKEQLNDVRKNKIGFIFQDCFLLDNLTIEQNITIINSISKGIFTENIEKILSDLDILEIKDKYPNQISGGERQRVAIARAILGGCKILLADEPTGNLDIDNSKNIYHILKKLSKDYLIIMVTHDIDACAYVDGIIKMTDINNISYDFSNDIIVESNEETHNIDLLTKLICRFKLAFQFIKKKKRFFISTIFIYIILMLFNLLISTVALLNPHETEYNIHKENNYETASYRLWGGMERINNENFNINIDSLSVTNYIACDIELSSFLDSDYVYENNLYTNYVKYIIIDDTLLDNEVVISNYLLDCLKFHKICFSDDEIINKECLNILGIKFKVVKIDNKDYNLSSAKEHIEHNYIKMSKKSFDQFNNYKLYEKYGRYDIVNYNDETNKIIHISRQYEGDELISGRLPLNENEIAVTLFFINGNKPLENIVNTTYNICGKDYTIVGVVKKEYLSFFQLTDSEYERLVLEYGNDLEKSSVDKGIVVNLEYEKEALKFMKKMYKEGYYSNQLIEMDCLNVISSLYIIKNSIFFVFMIFIIITTLMLNYIFSNSMNNYKKEIAVLVAQGGSKTDVVNVVSLPILISYLISFTTSVILYIAFMPLISNLISNILKYDNPIIHFDIIAIIISFIIFIISYGLSLYLSNLNVKKKTVIDMLYNR